MRKALIISLWSVLLSQTAVGQKTYLDSLNKAFDNCVFLHDSLVKELIYANDNAYIDSAIQQECVDYSKLLEFQIDELEIQIVQLKSISRKANENYESLLKSNKQERKKAKASTILSGVLCGVGGAGVGAVITAIYFLLK